MGLLNEYEIKAWKNQKLVLGIDEAGRGPMAGPCVVCGVVFPIGYENELINDSKQLSQTKRESLVEIIKRDALAYEIKIVSVEAIDELNIYQATKLAMMNIAQKMQPDLVLTDAMPFELEDKEVISIVKGDQLSISIAAASILAKTKRDEIMFEFDALYPEYGFKDHKGYGTKKHKEAILKYGRTPIHRKSFRFKDEGQISLDI
ncbi:MAG: ribonuclease HII [Erysipelothrix sp.]|nr:ribonuclease HII [Erysipelothrix sp.]